MNRVLSQLRLCVAVTIGAVLVIVGLPEALTRVHAETFATPTPYHEGIPDADATPHAMAEHGRAMTAQVTQLRDAGALPLDLADQLAASGADLIANGERLERNGQRMQETTDQMLALIGQ